MSGIATQAGMMRGGAGGSPLLEGLLDWWDSASITGQHAGLVCIDAATAFKVGPDPWGGNEGFYTDSSDTWRPACPIAIDFSQPFTIAGVYWRVDGSEQIYTMRNHSAEVNSASALFSWAEVINPSGMGQDPVIPNSSVASEWSSGGWGSVVQAYDGTTYRIWINGILRLEFVTSLSGVIRVANTYQFRRNFQQAMAVGVQSLRAWTQEDADLFHNGGSFVRYSDL